MSSNTRPSVAKFDWIEAHAALTRLARERAAADAEEGRWLLRAWRAAVHVHLGHGSFAEYIERVFAYKPRTTQDKLRVAEALEQLPGLGRALEAGELSWCAVRELTRVAVPDTERAWIDAARGKTIRELEELVSRRSLGDAPDAPGDTPRRSRVLRFEVAPETFAVFRDAMQRLRRSAGGGLDDDAVLLAMARHVLVGPADEGRASYQVWLNVCSACGRGEQLGGGELAPVGAEVVAMAGCDSQLFGRLPPRAANENGATEKPATEKPATDDPLVKASERRAVSDAAKQDHSSSSPALAPDAGTRPDAHMGAPERSDNHASHAAKDATCVTDTTKAQACAPVHIAANARAKQTIPPAMRRAVLARDRHRCRVPGCSHATFLDLHHIQPRSEGGGNEAWNIVTICGSHHRATHRGELVIERKPDGTPTFRHADGTPYGHAVAAPIVDAHAKVFAALRHLGFREGEVKAVLAELLADGELREAPVERLLREALCRIRTGQ